MSPANALKKAEGLRRCHRGVRGKERPNELGNFSLLKVGEESEKSPNGNGKLSPPFSVSG